MAEIPRVVEWVWSAFARLESGALARPFLVFLDADHGGGSSFLQTEAETPAP